MGICALFPFFRSRDKSSVNLSDACIDRLMNSETWEERKNITPHIPIEDDEWMRRLKCIDDSHSNAFDLSIQAVQKLMVKVESQIEPVRPLPCQNDKLVECLKKHPKCMIKCNRLINDFIDCIDTQRITILKEKIEMERKAKKKRGDEDMLKEYLK